MSLKLISLRNSLTKFLGLSHRVHVMGDFLFQVVLDHFFLIWINAGDGICNDKGPDFFLSICLLKHT